MRSPAALLMLAVVCLLGGAALAVGARELDEPIPGTPRADRHDRSDRPTPHGDRSVASPHLDNPHRNRPAPPASSQLHHPHRSRPSPTPRAHPRPDYRASVAIGSSSAGSLVRGVKLPARSPNYFTWDPIQREQPNRGWRRWGTDELVRTLLRVVRDHRRAYPRGPRIGIGDLSRPRGGDFGPQFGGIGHASHQNGLDADVYYPRLDRAERSPEVPSEVDQRLAQDLVDRFVAVGAVKVFVGPSLSLTGPPGVVAPLVNHDNHLHVRLAP